MGRGRNLLLMLVVAAGLGGYIYFVELPRDAASDQPARDKVFSIEPGTIQEIEITNATAEVVKAVKQDAAWTLTAPEAASADTTEVSTVASSLESLERTKVIDENPATAVPFGLATPRIRVAFKTAADAPAQTLLIGNKTPTGGDLYAMVDGEPAIFLIGSYLESTFNKTPFDLRDKTVLRFDRAGVDTITLAQGGTRVGLSKTGSDWRLTAPIEARADSGAVESLISQIDQAKMTEIDAPDVTGAGLSEYGLDRPQLLMTLGAGSAKAEVAIGKEKDDTHVFARDLSRPMVFTIDKTVLDQLAKKADDFRVKDVFAYRSFTALGVDVTLGGETYTFAKTKPEGENTLEHWGQTAPATEQKLDETKFDDFLMTMSNLRAESFAARPFAGADTLTLTARFGDAASPQTETVTFRKSGDIVHAIRSGEPGAAVVSTTDFDRAVGLIREITGAK